MSIKWLTAMLGRNRSGRAFSLVSIERKGDEVVIENRTPIGPFPENITAWLTRGARLHPERIALAERLPAAESWRTNTYAQIAAQVDRVAMGLLQQGIVRGDRICAIAPNSIDHAVLQFAALSIGAILAPISPGYARGRADYSLFSAILSMLRPKLLYVSDLDSMQPALAACATLDARIVVGAAGLQGLAAEADAPRLAAARAGVGGDDAAKILLTSGSTGSPKGVVNTHRMIGANQAAFAAVWPVLSARPPVTVCWLPWHHTMGGNYSLFSTIANGGSLYIDDGSPTAQGIERTVQNLRSVKPTIYANVPRGFDMLLPFLQQRDAAPIFERLEALVFSGAPLSSATWSGLRAAAQRASGKRLPILTSWGTTETSPAITVTSVDEEDSTVIGLPLPGVTVKLVPAGDLLEAHVRGPNVMPGYYTAQGLDRSAIDTKGFYATGDALRVVETGGRIAGLAFNGRVAENFKLTTGTWVHVGSLRVKVLAATAPLLQDCVLTGEAQGEVGLIAFPNIAAIRQLCPDIPDDPQAAVLDARFRNELRARLERFNRANPGSTHAIRRVFVDPVAPIAEAGEIADKGYVNQRAVLRRRADVVNQLYCGGDAVIMVGIPADEAGP